MSGYYLDATEFDALAKSMAVYGEGASDLITETLHTEAGPIIKQYVDLYMPVSGRNWAGKKQSAKGASWARYDKDQRLAVTVATKAAYHYLYFPDDGTDTVFHVGNQQFFQRGVEAAAPEVIDLCLKKLTTIF